MTATPSPQSLTHPKYRPDIDGLRAVAVLSVVGFHAVPGLAKGGFIGVDIFFVISGFLISTIIFENLERGTLSFGEFYRRRVKRIFPALIVVLAACLAIGWFILMSDEYRQLGNHVVWGAGFLSNVRLWMESGYFDTAADTKPLLHLWSLGIEEQFYIVWPALLWLSWRARIPLLPVLVAIGAGSFALNVARVQVDPVGTFYLPQTRSWELLTGALLAYLAVFKSEALRRVVTPRANAVSWSGAALLAIGFVFVTKERLFPGWWALLPTFGAVALIAAGAQAWFNRKVLSQPILVWFGLISYPLYLWHWPLLAFLRVVQGAPGHIARFIAVALSVSLAWLTYRLIEKPIRFHKHRLEPAYSLAAVMLCVLVAGGWTFARDGFPGHGPRTPERSAFAQYFENSPPEKQFFATIGMRDKFREDCNFYETSVISRSCYERTPGATRSVFIWGDSHAQQLYYGLKQTLPASWDVLIVASSACKADAFVTEVSESDFCRRSNGFAMKTIRQVRPDVVIVAQVRDHDFDRLMKIGAELKSAGVGKVIFTGPSPQWIQDLPKVVLRRLWNDTPERTFTGLNTAVLAQDRALKARFAGQHAFTFVDLIDVFCNDQGCLTRIGDDKKTGITSWDYGHLTPIASEYLARRALAPAVLDAK